MFESRGWDIFVYLNAVLLLNSVVTRLLLAKSSSSQSTHHPKYQRSQITKVPRSDPKYD